MQRIDLQKQACYRTTTEKLEEVVHYLAALGIKTREMQQKEQKGLGTLIHELFKHFGGVELHIPYTMREPPRESNVISDACTTLNVVLLKQKFLLLIKNNACIILLVHRTCFSRCIAEIFAHRQTLGKISQADQIYCRSATKPDRN